MADLAITLFGQFEASPRGFHFTSSRSRELLAYLLLAHGRPTSHDLLIEHLWPDECQPENARHALNTELWRLRRTISSSAFSGNLVIERTGSGIRLLPHRRVSIDLFRFLNEVATLRASPGSKRASEAAKSIEQIYVGDLLPEFYADWALIAREAARNDYVFAMEHRLAEAMRAGDWSDAIQLGRRILRVEPLLEHVHRHLITCQLRMGNRAAAILQFRDLERRLARDLDCAPMPETLELLVLLNGATDPSPVPLASACDKAPRFTMIARQLEQAVAALAAAADALRRLDSDRPRAE